MRTYKRKKKARSAIAAAILLLVFFAAGYILISLVRGTPMVPVKETDITVAFDGTVIPEVSGSARNLTVWQSDFRGALEFSINPFAVGVTAKYKDETEFFGSAKDFDSFIPKYNGEYEIEITAEFRSLMQIDTYNYSFNISYAAETEFYLTATELVSGDAFLIVGQNLRNQNVTVQLDYPYEPFLVFDSDGGCVGYIPVNHLRATGDYFAAITYNSDTTELLYHVEEAEFEVQHMLMPESTSSSTVDDPAASDEYSEVLIPMFESFDEKIYWSQQFIQPVEGEITTEYGTIRYTNNDPEPSRHAGIDIACAEGTPIAAANTGKVIFSGELLITGKTVLIEHGLGLHTLYQHLDEIDCKQGDIVEIGEIIGTVGTTGYSTGPHLHFEVMIGFQSINPWRAFDGTSGIYHISS